MKGREQHPKVHQNKDADESNWFFRYWKDQLLPNEIVKTTREIHRIGPSKGPAALTRLQAQIECDKFLERVNVESRAAYEGAFENRLGEIAAIAFGKLAGMWELDYVERVVGGKALVAASTKQKYRNHLHKHILPRWAEIPIGKFRAKDVLDWLQEESGSWYMMTDLRNIMSGIFTKAQEWEILPDTFSNPIARVKLPKKWLVYERRILTEEETVCVLSRLKDPNLLISELCLVTGARISEVTGLQIKHVDNHHGCIRIEQRHWRGDDRQSEIGTQQTDAGTGEFVESCKTVD